MKKRFIPKNIKSIIGYTIFSLVVFLLSLYILFPIDAIKARIIYEIEKGTATEIKTTGDRWLFPLGLAFKGIEFRRKEGNTNHPLLRIDRLAIAVPVKSIFSLSPVFTLTADIYSGTARGLLTLSDNNRIFQAKWNNVDVSRIDRLKEVPAEISGKVSGDLVIRLMNNTPEGQIRLLIKEGRLSKLKVMEFPLPDIPIEELQGVIDVKGNTLSVKDGHFKNRDLKGNIKGDIQFQPAKGSGDLNISIRFSVGERMKKDYLGLLSFIERTKDREGYYTIQIKGDIKKPTVGI